MDGDAKLYSANPFPGLTSDDKSKSENDQINQANLQSPIST